MAIVRANVIARMRGAFRRGQSAGSFIRAMREKGLTYRRTDMLSDWRSVNELERKSDAFRSVRKDYYPTKVHIAEVEWRLSQEYMYKVKVESRLRPDMPITERFVNIMSDTLMTPRMVEQAVIEKWTAWEDYTAEAIEKIAVWTAVHRVAI
ncbi:hypothetical protein ES707_09380 [subsurface metagenome]